MFMEVTESSKPQESNYIEDQFTTIICKYDIITFIAMTYAHISNVLGFYNKIYSDIYKKIEDLGNKLLYTKARGSNNNPSDEDYISYIAYNFILYSDYYAGYCLDFTEPQTQQNEFFFGYFPINYFEQIYNSLHSILKSYMDSRFNPNLLPVPDEILQQLPIQLFGFVTSAYQDNGNWFFKSIDYHLPTHFLTVQSLAPMIRGVDECIKVGANTENMSQCLKLMMKGADECIKVGANAENMSQCLNGYIHQQRLAAPAAGGSIINNILKKLKVKKRATKRRQHKSQKHKNRKKYKSIKNKSRKYKSRKYKSRKNKSRKYKSRIPKLNKAL